MAAYDRKLVKRTRAFDKFKKYFLKGKNYPKETKIRLFFSKAQGTIVASPRDGIRQHSGVNYGS